MIVKLWGRLWSIGMKVLAKTAAAVKLYSKRPLTIIGAIGLTFLLQGACIIGFWLLGRDLGINAHIKYYFVLFPVSWLIGALPISIGGIGIMEGWLKLMFLKLFAVTSLQASAVGLCQRLIWLLGSLPGLGIHLAGAHLPSQKDEFFVDSQDITG